MNFSSVDAAVAIFTIHFNNFIKSEAKILKTIKNQEISDKLLVLAIEKTKLLVSQYSLEISDAFCTKINDITLLINNKFSDRILDLIKEFKYNPEGEEVSSYLNKLHKELFSN
jgi:non-homologous end joining protein Ku